MRLPADATLIVLGAPERQAAEDPPEQNIAALVAAWRSEALPIVYVRPAPDGPRRPFGAGAAPLAAETIVERRVGAPFAGSALGDTLDAFGATTLVFCGDAAAMPDAARAAGVFGCHAFVVADACWSGDLAEFAALLAGEDAKVVDCASVLRAASVAKARQRRQAMRRG